MSSNYSVNRLAISMEKYGSQKTWLGFMFEIGDPSCSAVKLMAVPGRTQMKLNDDHVECIM